MTLEPCRVHLHKWVSVKWTLDSHTNALYMIVICFSMYVAVAKASALVLSTRQSHSETNDLAKINKNIIVLPLDHRKEDLDKFIANHVKRLDIDIWVLVPLTGLGEKGIEKKLSIFKQMRDCAEREASLPKGTFALQCLVLGNNAAHALENKQAFVERCEDFSSLYIISTYMIGSKDIAKFIQEHANNRLAKMRQILKTIDSGKFYLECKSLIKAFHTNAFMFLSEFIY